MRFRSLPYKTKQFFFVLIKLSIVVGAFYFIFKKIVSHEELYFSDFLAFLNKNDVFSLKNMLFLIILSGFNWFFEILKWQTLVSFVKTISFKNALEQSLGALTASLLTPNRIGEYGAKAIYYSTSFRKKIVLLNLLGNVMQMSMTVLFGCVGIIIFAQTYPIEVDSFKIGKFITILIIVSLFAFFIVQDKNFKIKGYSINDVLNFYKKIPRSRLITSSFLSYVRYIIFSFQWYYLLQIFGVNVSYYNAMVVITTMYFFASIIPTIFIFDVVVKGSVAVYLFSIVGVNELTILCIIMTMWLLNVVLPSIFGSYYVLNFNLSKDSNL